MKVSIGLTRKQKSGYIKIKTKGGWEYEHRYIMSQYLGRLLEKDEVVHHKNGIKDDNRLQNLELCMIETHLSGQRVKDIALDYAEKEINRLKLENQKLRKILNG